MKMNLRSTLDDNTDFSLSRPPECEMMMARQYDFVSRK
jgi:hypothetical protein